MEESKEQKLTQAVERYKKLLGLARKSLEDTTRKLQERDELVKRLEQRGGAGSAEEGEGGVSEVLVRVDFEDQVHLLCCQGSQDFWRTFRSADAANDYIRRDSGEPLTLPDPHVPRSLLDVETQALRTELESCKEDFRRFRIKSQISLKQKERQAEEASSRRTLDLHGSLMAGGAAAAVEEETTRRFEERIGALQRERDSWRQLYEESVAEKEVLLSGGVETHLAQSWRKRFQDSERERERLKALLGLYQSPDAGGPDSAAGGKNAAWEAGLNVMPREELLEKHKGLLHEYRAYQQEASRRLRQQGSRGARDGAPPHGAARRPAGRGAASGKLLYVKNLLVQHWTTAEEPVRLQTRETLKAVLDLTAQERADVDAAGARGANWLGGKF